MLLLVSVAKAYKIKKITQVLRLSYVEENYVAECYYTAVVVLFRLI